MHATLKATVGDRLLLVIDFCISVTAVGLFSSAYLGHHRDRLWEFGGVEGWNSNPKERVYFYANYKEPPVIPLIWTQRLTDASLAVALLSIFIMVARMVMTSCGQMSRTFSMLYDAFLAFVWIYSVSSQASGDYSDMEHPSPHPCQVETVTFVAGAGSSVISDAPPANDASNRRETALHLGNTLRSVALAIQDRDKGTSDGTILAVWILGMYELQIGGISGQSSRKSAWHVHLEGLLSLLRARGKAQFYTPFGRYIFWCVFMTLQTGCLMANEACPPESDEWVGLLEDTRDPDEGWSPEFATATYASWFEGMSQISPLSHVYTTRTVPKHLRNTARLALLAIGKERGILQAFKTRPGAVQYAAEAAVGISLDDTMENVTEVT
ncbi:hypothetical protein HYQ46_007030 [Verticillium longisporum]|nr:hypothetical protein HYQ46_007030 [Verticillium longisporum]